MTCFQYKQKEEETITISVHGPKGKLVLLVNEAIEKFPTREDYDEISYNNYMQIDTKKLTACVEALESSFVPRPDYVDKEYEDLNQTWMNTSHYNDLNF